jgi:hypothetical protein
MARDLLDYDAQLKIQRSDEFRKRFSTDFGG